LNRFAWFRNAPGNSRLLVMLAILGSVVGSAKAQTQPALFQVVPQIPFSNDAFNVFAGDINGDGTPDLAYFTLTSSAATLGILLNVGSSAPTTVTTNLCPAPSGVPQVNLADLNNDKKLDLVFFCNGYLTIQLGNGDGTFQTPAYFAGYQGAPVFVDLNGDGYLDIATLGGPANATPQVSIYLNQGSGAPGTFASAKLYPAANASGLQAGDFNGDGKADLLTTVYSSLPTSAASTAISVFYGNGDGTLNPAKTQSMASFSSFTVGDFNGDGVTDVAVMPISSADNLYASVQIELGSSSGTFAPGAAMPILATSSTASGYGTALTTAALTTDGNLDLVVTTSVVSIFHGDGKGNFTATGSYAPGYVGNPLLFADVNGDGKQDMILGNTAADYIFAGNGDGTFQAPPATPVYGPIADVNNDGIADILFLPPRYSRSVFGIALGRGDGTFAILNQTIPLPGFPSGLMTGDFNGDGKIDTLAIQAGTHGNPFACDDQSNSQVLTYLGNGDGTFQEKGTGLPLGVVDPAVGITGDFNSDGKLDLILPYNPACHAGLIFLAGNGDGTFATPALLNVAQSLTNPSLLAGDLNNDKKLDFIWGNAVFLGNGDGTFKQIPLNIDPSPVVALTDLNGDGILDAVSSPGVVIYAGNGDGTFQTSPFFNMPNLNPSLFASGNVDGNANPDLLPVGQSLNFSDPVLTPYLGDGHGNFTQDTNTYLAGIQQLSTFQSMPVRLNTQAPPLASDNTLDLLVSMLELSDDVYTASLINQSNPAPVRPALINSRTALQASPSTTRPGGAIALTATVLGTNPSGSVSFSANGNTLGTAAVVNGSALLQTSFANVGTYAVTATYTGDSNNTPSTSSAVTVTIASTPTTTTLQASPSTGSLNQQITLKASVSGASPTGKVSFAVGSTSLGTATLASGVATLATSFATAGSYSITATYAGDQNNSASTSSSVTVTIGAPDFSVAATPAPGSITPGQSATFTFTVSPTGGYAGTVKFSCGTLPSLAACSFSPASVSPSGGSPVSSTLTVTTAAATAALRSDRPCGPSVPPWLPPTGLAMAGVLGLSLAPRRMRRWRQSLRMLSWGFLLASLSLSLMGCGGGGNSSPSNPGTPAGSYTLSVTASDSGGGPQHATNITLAVN
jgi:hypothetical protein